MSALDSRKENQVSQSSLQRLKHAAHRVLKPTTAPNSVLFDDRQITLQITDELASITQLLQQCEVRRRCCGSPARQIGHMKEIIQLQEVLGNKDAMIRSIGEEIKALKSANQLKEEPKQPASGLFQLAEELRAQRGELASLLEMHASRLQKQRQLKGLIRRAQQRYQQKCSDRLVSYEEFKLSQEERRYYQRRHVELRTVIKVESSQPRPEGSKSMRQLQSKKAITETAIKNSKKKHHAETYELNAKLEFLRDEDTLLSQKLREIEAEKTAMETKLRPFKRHHLKPSPSFLKSE